MNLFCTHTKQALILLSKYSMWLVSFSHLACEVDVLPSSLYKRQAVKLACFRETGILIWITGLQSSLGRHVKDLGLGACSSLQLMQLRPEVGNRRIPLLTCFRSGQWLLAVLLHQGYIQAWSGSGLSWGTPSLTVNHYVLLLVPEQGWHSDRK